MPGQGGDHQGVGLGLLLRVTWCRLIQAVSPQDTALCGVRLVTVAGTKNPDTVKVC